MGRKKELTKARFEALLIKASQPLQGKAQKPDSASSGTSELPTSGDCNERNTHSDTSEDT